MKKTYDAEFSEVFDFAARGSAPFSTLTLTLMDWDKMSKDDYIGEVAFALTPEALAKDQVHVLNVKDKSNGGKKVTGHDGQVTEVHVKVTAEAEPAPQPQPEPHTAPISRQPRAIAASGEGWRTVLATLVAFAASVVLLPLCREFAPFWS